MLLRLQLQLAPAGGRVIVSQDPECEVRGAAAGVLACPSCDPGPCADNRYGMKLLRSIRCTAKTKELRLIGTVSAWLGVMPVDSDPYQCQVDDGDQELDRYVRLLTDWINQRDEATALQYLWDKPLD